MTEVLPAQATPAEIALVLEEGHQPRDAQMALDMGEALGGTFGVASFSITRPDITLEEWKALGRIIAFIGRSVAWWSGDWMNIGEALFGEDAAEGSDTPETRFDLVKRVTGLEPTTLQNYRSVAEKVPAERRRHELSFAHHQDVASLEPAVQEHWLAQAVDQMWNRSALRTALREARGDAPKAEEQQEIFRTLAQRIQDVARDVLNQSQPIGDGDYRIPGELRARLAEAFGEE